MKKRIAILTVVALICSTGTSFAAGFALAEQSVKGLGNAFAGGAAVAEDATTVFFNPAGMSRLEGMNITAGLHYIVPSAKFTKTSATQPVALTGNTTTPQTGGDGGDGGVSAFVPNFFFTAQAGEKWNYGIGINTPFGMATKYDEDWVGRFHGIESHLMSININPSASYKVNDQFSLGLGVSAQYLDAELSQEAVFGPGQSSFSEVKGDSWGYGYNLGLMYEFNDNTRIGASYRSSVFHSVDGTIAFRDPAASFANGNVTGKITLPASAQASVFHSFNGKFDIMADVMWTEWSVFEDLTFQTPIGTSTTVENWKNNMRYSVGGTFHVNEKLALRTGVAYDQTPIPDETRTPRIPGADRTWLSIGAGYAPNAWSFDFAYAHIWVDDGSINLTDELTTKGALVGSFANAVDIVSVEASYKF